MLNELLLRFRNAGVPGAAGAPAVPAEALDAELAPIFDLFEQRERAADAIDAKARRRAEESRAGAAEKTRLLLDDAHTRSAGEQNTEAAAWFARADTSCVELRTQSVVEVARIDGAVRQRLPPLVTELVARILSEKWPTISGAPKHVSGSSSRPTLCGCKRGGAPDREPSSRPSVSSRLTLGGSAPLSNLRRGAATDELLDVAA